MGQISTLNPGSKTPLTGRMPMQSMLPTVSEVQSGAVINKLSDKMATSGVQYNFSVGTFDTPTEVARAANSNSNTDSTEE